MPKEALTDVEPYINFQKSIEKQRLVYQKTAGFIFSLVISYLACLLFFFLATVPLLALITGSNVPVWVAFGCIAFIAWMIANIVLNNAFVKINGDNTQGNRDDILKILALFYNDLNVQVNDEKMIRSYKPIGSVFFGRTITIIFDKNTMLLNITKLGKTTTPTFVHGLLNYLKAKKNKKRYETGA